MGMDLSQLRAFVALAELKHFGRAAQRLHITQPALTKRLRVLETTIGAQLFERDRKGTVLTSIGEALLTDAISITADTDSWLVRARNVVQGMAGHLDIGFGLSTIDIAPKLIAEFRRSYPSVVVSLNDFSSAEQVERLLDGRLDLGFVRLPVEFSSVVSRSLATDRLAIAGPQGWFDERNPINLEEHNDTGFILLDRTRGPGLRTQIDRWCVASSFQPRITQTADDIQTVLALVAAGVGLSILPEQAVRLMGNAIALWPLAETEAEWQTGVAWRSGASNPALLNFMKLIDK